MSRSSDPGPSASLFAAATLRRAIRDYRGLLDRGYPDKQVLQLVGDRYRLTRDYRGMLQRGVFSTSASERRMQRRLTRIQCAQRCTQAQASGRRGELLVDGHNVLFTMWNCRAGRPIVHATDGFIRDIGGTSSRLPHDERFSRLAVELCEVIASLELPAVRVLLDEQIPYSGDQRSELEALWQQRGDWESDDSSVQVSFETNRSVDACVAADDSGTEVIATSDTGIIDRCEAEVFDLGGYVVEQIYRRSPRRL
ncbi:MAG: DUF434 domain-containing protein [Spirochaetaceae bacterium]|nr:MAG: DUF434 domain-containing protein [Spirochaetaceae bacterium]